MPASKLTDTEQAMALVMKQLVICIDAQNCMKQGLAKEVQDLLDTGHGFGVAEKIQQIAAEMGVGP